MFTLFFFFFLSEAASLANNKILTDIFCYSWNPEENPRWQHLGGSESFSLENIKVISQEEREKVKKRGRYNIKQHL